MSHKNIVFIYFFSHIEAFCHHSTIPSHLPLSWEKATVTAPETRKRRGSHSLWVGTSQEKADMTRQLDIWMAAQTRATMVLLLSMSLGL